MTETQQESTCFLEVENLKKHYPIYGGILSRPVAWVHAVDGVSFRVRRGETFGLVGESGSGKTTLGRAVSRLVSGVSGSVRLEGRDILGVSGKELKALRPHVQMVFQDPYSSLNPRMTVAQVVGEPLKIHSMGNDASIKKRVHEMLETVGLHESDADRYPHEFSGGQRQRIGIAKALILRPEMVICDEPVSALDVSIQSQILILLNELQRTFSLTYIFIAHGLHVVRHIADTVGVMYLGTMVEIGPSDSLFAEPLHPYTRALISAVPIPEPGVRRERIVLQGDIPSPVTPPPGCRFHSRCSFAFEQCRVEEPPLIDVGGSRWVACHRAMS